MRGRGRWWVVAVAALAAVASFVATRAFAGDRAPGGAAPAGDAVVVVVPTPVPPGGDAVEVAEALAAEMRQVRDVASEIGEIIEDSTLWVEEDGGFSFPDLVTFDFSGPYPFDEEDGTDGDEAAEATPLPMPPVGDDAASDRAVDGCASEAPPDDCPAEGVGGTVLFHTHIQPLQAIIKIDPYAPGTAPFVFWPECPPVEPALGRAYVGVATNRPADVTLLWSPYSPYGTGLSDPASASASTSSEQEAAWAAWAADDGAGFDDPRSWINHCFLLEGLTPRMYAMEALVVDRLAFAESYRTRPVVFLRVPDESGEVPRQRRKPTSLVPLGPDRLLVGATRESGQVLVVRAIPASRGATCDTGGDPARALRSGPGEATGAIVFDLPIPRARRENPDYPYLPLHDRNVLFALDLEEGSDYLVCLWWVRGGLTIDLVEQVRVTTPNAYRPVVLVHGLSDPIVDIPRAGVEMECSGATRGWNFGPVASPPLRVCAFSNGLWEVDLRRGFTVTTSLMWEGSFHERTVFVRTGRLGCRVSPCLLRLNETVRVPLPEIRTERRLCGSGWGSSCSEEIPRRTAGYVILEVRYDRTMDGVATWVIGGADEFADTRPEQPRMSTRFTIGRGGDIAVDGMRAAYVVEADRPIRLSAALLEVAEGRDTCFIAEPPAPFEATEASRRHEFRFEGLCADELYGLVISGSDEEGNEAVLVDRESGEVVPQPLNVVVRPAYVDLESDIVVPMPGGGSVYTVVVEFGGMAATISAIGPVGVDYFGGSRCTASSDPVRFGASTWGWANHGPLVVAARVQVIRNRPVGGSILSECVRGEVVSSWVLRGEVSLAQLAEGVTLTSEDGAVVYRIRARRVLEFG